MAPVIWVFILQLLIFCQNVLKQIKQSGVLSMHVNYNTAHE